MPDPHAIAAVTRRGRSALAWEVLRRNPAYQAAFAGLAAPQPEPAFAADWGLHFP
jgi:hypothetical protein